LFVTVTVQSIDVPENGVDGSQGPGPPVTVTPPPGLDAEAGSGVDGVDGDDEGVLDATGTAGTAGGTSEVTAATAVGLVIVEVGLPLVPQATPSNENIESITPIETHVIRSLRFCIVIVTSRNRKTTRRTRFQVSGDQAGAPPGVRLNLVDSGSGSTPSDRRMAGIRKVQRCPSRSREFQFWKRWLRFGANLRVIHGTVP
jgi:hypothetical protein